MSHTCRGCGLAGIPNKAALREHLQARQDCTDVIEERALYSLEREVGLEGLAESRKPVSPLARAILRNQGRTEL